MFCRVHPTPSNLSALCPQHILQPVRGKPETGTEQQREGPLPQARMGPAGINGPLYVSEGY